MRFGVGAGGNRCKGNNVPTMAVDEQARLHMRVVMAFRPSFVWPPLATVLVPRSTGRFWLATETTRAFCFLPSRLTAGCGQAPPFVSRDKAATYLPICDAGCSGRRPARGQEGLAFSLQLIGAATGHFKHNGRFSPHLICH